MRSVLGRWFLISSIRLLVRVWVSCPLVGSVADAAGAETKGVVTPAATPSGTAVQHSVKAEDFGAPMDTDMNTEVKTEVGSYATVPPSVMASSASAAGGARWGLRPCGPGRVCHATYHSAAK